MKLASVSYHGFLSILHREFVNSQFLRSLQFSHFVNTSNLSLEVLFLVEPTLREAWPALFEMFHIQDWYGQSPNDWNEFVFEVHE